MEIFFFWFALSIVVGVAANARGRDGFGWFVLAIVLTPVIALLLVLVMKRKDSQPAKGAAFQADGVLAGIPYRSLSDGSIEAVMQGATVRFVDYPRFAAAVGVPVQPEQPLHRWAKEK
ncbi:phosphotransferase system glucose/maltose/N-acetylglucosamine-specific IIC component [Bradyrhizobium sp. i1.8.4]|uniref:hypothetical protein n=1 Tax=unclassified Bradyrhizobium TaxID=2631580 RepID=UPI003D1B51D8